VAAATVRRAVETTGGLAGVCTRVPPAGPDVCRCCHGRTRPGFPLCFPCGSVRRQVWRPCDRVAPISLYRRGDRLHVILRRYKDDPDAGRREWLSGQVGALVSRFLWEHGSCVAPGGWDAVAVVPSTTGRSGAHPLAGAAGRVPWLAPQLVEALRPAGARLDHNAADDRAFAAVGEVAGLRVLLLDDTYTTGARAQSAASALARAGAEVPAIVTVGRVVTPAAAPAVARWWRSRRAVWDPTSCCFEDAPSPSRAGYDESDTSPMRTCELPSPR